MAATDIDSCRSRVVGYRTFEQLARVCSPRRTVRHESIRSDDDRLKTNVKRLGPVDSRSFSPRLDRNRKSVGGRVRTDDIGKTNATGRLREHVVRDECIN